MKKTPDRYQPFQQINETSSVVNDLNLYLDTYPTDDQALGAFNQVVAQREQLLGSFAKEYEPLILNCVRSETGSKSGSHIKYPGQKHFIWSDGPLSRDCPGH